MIKKDIILCDLMIKWRCQDKKRDMDVYIQKNKYNSYLCDIWFE